MPSPPRTTSASTPSATTDRARSSASSASRPLRSRTEEAGARAAARPRRRAPGPPFPLPAVGLVSRAISRATARRVASQLWPVVSVIEGDRSLCPPGSRPSPCLPRRARVCHRREAGMAPLRVQVGSGGPRDGDRRAPQDDRPTRWGSAWSPASSSPGSRGCRAAVDGDGRPDGWLGRGRLRAVPAAHRLDRPAAGQPVRRRRPGCSSSTPPASGVGWRWPATPPRLLALFVPDEEVVHPRTLLPGAELVPRTSPPLRLPPRGQSGSSRYLRPSSVPP